MKVKFEDWEKVLKTAANTFLETRLSFTGKTQHPSKEAARLSLISFKMHGYVFFLLQCILILSHRKSND